MKQQIIYDIVKGIPFEDVVGAIEKMQYGSTERVMFQMLFITGCRITELDNMNFDKIFPYHKGGYIIFWKKGKNQNGLRKERLSIRFYRELLHYRKHNRVYLNQLFGVKAQTFTRYFNRDIRPILSSEWKRKAPNPENNWKLEHIYKVKGLRKDFWTLDYKNNLEKFKSPEIALEQTCKRAGHHSKHITYNHYIQSFDDLKIDKFAGMTPEEILNYNSEKQQTRLCEWF